MSYNLDLIILYIASLLLFFFPHLPKKNYMSKKEGILFLGSYITYMLITIFQ